MMDETTRRSLVAGNPVVVYWPNSRQARADSAIVEKVRKKDVVVLIYRGSMQKKFRLDSGRVSPYPQETWNLPELCTADDPQVIRVRLESQLNELRVQLAEASAACNEPEALARALAVFGPIAEETK